MIPNIQYVTANGKKVEQPREWDDVQSQALHELVLHNTPVKLVVCIEFDPDLNPQKDATECLALAARFVRDTLQIDDKPVCTSTTHTTHELRYPDHVLANTEALALVWSHMHMAAESSADPSELRVLRRVDGAVREQWLFCFGAIPTSIKAPEVEAHLLHNIAVPPPPFWPIPAQWKPRAYPQGLLVGGPGYTMTAPFDAATALLTAAWPERAATIISVTPMHPRKPNKLMPLAVRIALATTMCHCDKDADAAVDRKFAGSYVDVHGEGGIAKWHCDYCQTERTVALPRESEAVYSFLRRYWSSERWMEALNATYTQLADGGIEERMVNEHGDIVFVSRHGGVKPYLRGHKYVVWTAAAPKKKGPGRPRKDTPAPEAAEEQKQWALLDPFDYWSESLDRARCKAKIFNPELPPGRRGDFLNMYEGFGMKPKESASGRLQDAAPLLRAHIRDVICYGNPVEFEFLETCLAQLVQCPWRKLGIVFVLKSKQGAGKNSLLDVLRKIFGHHGIEVTSAKHATGNFNQHLQNKILVILNEAVWGGDKQSEGTLKAAITESATIFEHKGVDAQEGTNYWTFFISTNEKWCIPASADARRYHMLPVSDARIGDAPYFSALHKAIEAGEDREYMWYLLHRRCPHPDEWQPCHHMPPRTRAFVEQMMQDRGQSLLRFLVSQLQEDGEWIYPALASSVPIIQRGRPTKVLGSKVLDAFRNTGDLHVRTQLTHQRDITAFFNETLGDGLFDPRARFLAAEQPAYTTSDKCYQFASAEDIMHHLSHNVLRVPNYFAPSADKDLQPQPKRARFHDDDAEDDDDLEVAK